MFEVVIQLGAILAVVVLYFPKALAVQKAGEGRRASSGLFKMETVMLWLKVVVAILPSAIVGIPFDDWMDAHLHNAPVVAAMLVIYGVAFILVEKHQHHAPPRPHPERRADRHAHGADDRPVPGALARPRHEPLRRDDSRRHPDGLLPRGGLRVQLLPRRADDGRREPDQGAQVRPVLHERRSC